jgi:citrate synthase
VTPSLFDPGLESITVAETELSDVDGAAGELVVGGYPIAELAANATYEETVALLFDGRLPASDSLRRFRSDLARRRAVDDDTQAALGRAARASAPPMDALRQGLGEATLGDDADPVATARRVVAVTPTVVASYWHHRQGDSPVAPDPELGQAANYRYMLTGEVPTDAETRALETFLTTMVDHGLNPSTFTARTVVSTESDLVSATTAAVGALKGRRHGGNLAHVFDLLDAAAEADDVDSLVHQRLADSGSLPGFGHRVYEVRDPRAAVLAAALEPLADTGAAPLLGTVRELEAAGVAALDDRGPDRPAVPTVEFYAAALLRAVGVPPALFTATFAVARVGGWMAHCLEQRADNELVRPVARYVGPTGRSWTPVQQRDERADGRRAVVDPAAASLSTLADPARLEILLALADAETPIAYSTLRAATTIEDKGRFNYHLRQLRGTFVADRGDGYALRPVGERVVETLLRDDLLRASE